MSLNLKSSGGGSVTVDVPSTASNYTATLPAGTGNVVVNGINGALVSGTAVASTSGTSIDFTGIPSWVKRITVMFNAVSTTGTSFIQIQVGSTSFSTSGYASQMSSGAANSNVVTTGLVVASMGAGATGAFTGSVTLCLIGSNTWIEQGVLAYVNGAGVGWSSGGSSPSLSGALDRVRITTTGGVETFDAGSINIMYE